MCKLNELEVFKISKSFYLNFDISYQYLRLLEFDIPDEESESTVLPDKLEVTVHGARTLLGIVFAY